jgi:hypothetical protein
LLVLDMLQMAQLHAYDIAVLVAGDQDFVEVVDTSGFRRTKAPRRSGRSGATGAGHA